MYRKRSICFEVITIFMFLAFWGGVNLSHVNGQDVQNNTLTISEELNDPVHYCDTKKQKEKDYSDWSYIYFGSYPQEEVEDISTIKKIDRLLPGAGGDVWVNGEYYRKIGKNDTNYAGKISEYHYFKWQRIRWKVLKIEGSKALVSADVGLDCQDYNEEDDYYEIETDKQIKNPACKDMTWEKCSLRKWLNSDAGFKELDKDNGKSFTAGQGFYTTAFNEKERKSIIPVSLANENNPSTGAQGGNDTIDNVFLLSWSDIRNQSFGFCPDPDCNSSTRQIKASDYCKAMGSIYTPYCYWYLRTIGHEYTFAASIMNTGRATEWGNRIGYDYIAIVPALWLDLNQNTWSVSNREAVKQCRVKFDTNGGLGNIEDQIVLAGKNALAPISPSREGYSFEGWYPNTSCTGKKWEFRINTINQDLTLYAKWTKKTISISSKDLYSFGNSKANYCTENDKYYINDQHYMLLKKDLTKAEINGINVLRNSWIGACTGITASLSLFKRGRMTPDFFASLSGYRANDVWELKSLQEDPKSPVISMINYYHLLQRTNYINELENADKNMSQKEVIQRIVKMTEEAEKNQSFVHISLQRFVWRTDFGIKHKEIALHSVAAYKVTRNQKGEYIIHLIDPNSKASELIIASDFSDAYFKSDKGKYSGLDVSSGTLMLHRVYSLNEFDRFNLQERLENYGAYNTASYPSNQKTEQSEEKTYRIWTHIPAFSIWDGDQNETKVIGSGVNGKINVELKSVTGEEDLLYEYEISNIKDCLHISADPDSQAESPECIMVSYEGDFLGSIKSERPVQFSVKEDGTISVEALGENSGITVGMPIDNNEEPYDRLEISLNAKEVTLEQADSAILMKASETQGAMKIKAYSDFSETSASCEATDKQVKISLDQEKLSIEQNDMPQITKSIGYKVLFVTGGGEEISPLENIEKGSLMEQPKNPVYPGHIFDGWYKDVQFTDDSKWIFGTDKVQTDTILYAKWKDDPSYWKTVVFEYEDQDAEIMILPAGTVLSSKDYPILPQREGFTGKWNISDSLTVISDMTILALYVPNNQRQKEPQIITLKRPALKKFKKAERAFEAKWKKVTDIDGYELQYSLKKSFKSARTKRISSKKTAYWVKKLKKGKKYYVRIRAYKTVNGKKIRSEWSKIRTVKI
ncbi:MAG: hypothetical protein E7294_06085 [Lachnospiraceae bacterium]|nr:hypothetical protein [Lachnospiraceae bacterium]